MNRRGFLSALIGFAATATLDPERLLWVPGQKLISIPAPSMDFLNVDQLLVVAMRNLGFVRPLSSDELTETFLEMGMMVQQQMARPIGRSLGTCLYAVDAAAMQSRANRDPSNQPA